MALEGGGEWDKWLNDDGRDRWPMKERQNEPCRSHGADAIARAHENRVFLEHKSQGSNRYLYRGKTIPSSWRSNSNSLDQPDRLLHAKSDSSRSLSSRELQGKPTNKRNRLVRRFSFPSLSRFRGVMGPRASSPRASSGSSKGGTIAFHKLKTRSFGELIKRKKESSPTPNQN